MHIVLIVIITIIVLLLLVLLYWRITDQMIKFWKIVRWIKRRRLQKNIDSIKLIYDRLKSDREVIDDKNKEKGITKRIKKAARKKKVQISGLIDRRGLRKDFENDKSIYNEYISFCNSKSLKISERDSGFKVIIDATEDLLYPDQAIDRRLRNVQEEYDRRFNEISESGEKLLSSRLDAVQTITSIMELVNSIAKHPKEFAIEVSEIVANKEKFKETYDFGKEEQKKLKQSMAGAGVGVAAGAAVATVGPSAALWVATTFGTASTGTAISALSGAAATNAALAWLGGGAVAAGGGGIASGQALLALAGPIGAGVAGASILASLIYFLQKKKKIQESKKQEIERIMNCTNSLRELKVTVDAIAKETDELNNLLFEQLEINRSINGMDYTSLSEKQKQSLGAMVNNTKSLSVLVSKVVS